jgi:NADP-dependent 3-hydroxy acid dehydrogenase YdfG
MGPFEGQGALVTGAGSGVGKAIALMLAEGGATVVLAGRDIARLEEVHAEIESGLICQGDLELDDDIAVLAARSQKELPGIDIVVHAAGTIEIDPIETAELDDFDVQYRTNVRGPYALTQALLPALRERNGQVVFINSTAGRDAGPGSSQYAATKAALGAVADSLRAEVNEDGVRVLSVFLGRAATPLQERLTNAEGREYRPEQLVQPEDVAGVVASALALPRTAEVTELALRPMKKPTLLSLQDACISLAYLSPIFA